MTIGNLAPFIGVGRSVVIYGRQTTEWKDIGGHFDCFSL